jgi:hypothetical protein
MKATLRAASLWAVIFAATVARAEPPAAAQAMALARDAAKAAEAKDVATYLSKMEAAVALRPDFPRMLVNLAAAQVANERPGEALATLERLAALGLSSPVEKSEEFAALRGRPEFKAVVAKLAANARPSGEGNIAFSLREVTGLIEGITWRAQTGEFFFGDVNGRAVWVRAKGPKDKEATLRRFTPEGDELLGVFGLAVDETAGVLWAATSAVPGMRGFTPDQDGTAALAEIDLQTGAVRRVIPLVRTAGDQQSHVLGDLALAPNGDMIAIQNGLRPNRVLRITLDAAVETVSAVAVLEAAHFTMAAPSLGCIATGGEFFFVGNAGWTRFEGTDGQPSAPRSVPVFHTKL